MVLNELKDKTDEWYTPKYAVEPILEFLKPNSRVWCPFDTKDSEYVKVLNSAGHKVINTHIWNGEDFLTYEPKFEYDYIISNPPYSIKNQILEKLFKLNKPFAMLMRSSGIFETPMRFNLFKDNRFEMLMFNKRIGFVSPDGVQTNSASFPSWYVCKGILPKQIVFKELDKPKWKVN